MMYDSYSDPELDAIDKRKSCFPYLLFILCILIFGSVAGFLVTKTLAGLFLGYLAGVVVFTLGLVLSRD